MVVVVVVVVVVVQTTEASQSCSKKEAVKVKSARSIENVIRINDNGMYLQKVNFPIRCSKEEERTPPPRGDDDSRRRRRRRRRRSRSSSSGTFSFSSFPWVVVVVRVVSCDASAPFHTAR